jgi:chemotaxis protein CheX
MSTVEKLNEETIRNHINRAVIDVFKIMLKAKVDALPRAEGEAPGHISPDLAARLAAPHVVGSVGFVGDINGIIYIYIPLTLAKELVSQLLGLDDADDGTICDAIGEMTNMTVGSFKNALCDAGFPCMLTIPSIITGSGISVETIGHTERYLYSFQYSGHRIIAAILMKTND